MCCLPLFVQVIWSRMSTDVFVVALCLLFTTRYMSLNENEDSVQRSSSMIIMGVRYTEAELRRIGTLPCHTKPLLDIDLPKEMRRRKRGKAGGIRRRNRNCKYRPYLPPIVMGNVRSLPNKIDELHANSIYLAEFRNACLMSFTETWLTSNHSDEHVNIDGLKLLRGDRNMEDAGKHSGGICVYVNHKWCLPNNAFIKNKIL